MKVLFVARHYTYFRNYDSVLRELAARGHRLHLAVEKQDALGGEACVEALAGESPQITYGATPERRVDAWSVVAQRLRVGIDYLRYLDPFYDTATLRRVRARERTPRLLAALADPPLLRGAWWRRIVGAALHRIDSAVPPPASIVAYLREQQPDVLVITPLVELGSQQVDYVRAARRLGIPCALAVWSWDHLTSKAYIRDCPERVLVWNETQRREAIEVHRVPAGRVVVTGAQCFDHWFTRQPSGSREQFCAQLGLPVDRPIVLYVCSGLIKGSPSEPEFVTEWLGWLRRSGDPLVANAGVLIRPYPSRMDVWQQIDLSAYGPVAVWGGNPVDERSRTGYFDSLYHSAAVVGLNTSAFLEAGIVGREVLAVLVPRFHDNQEGTEHFRYLLKIGGGLLRVGRDRASHVKQLGEALRRRVVAGEHPHRAFLESFIRPRGLGEPATPAMVQAIEDLATCVVDTGEAAADPERRRATLGRVVRLAARLPASPLRSWARELDASERWRTFRAQKEGATRALREQRRAARDARIAEKQRQRESQLREKRRLRDAHLQQKQRTQRDDERRRAVLKRRTRLKQLIRQKLGWRLGGARP